MPVVTYFRKLTYPPSRADQPCSTCGSATPMRLFTLTPTGYGTCPHSKVVPMCDTCRASRHPEATENHAAQSYYADVDSILTVSGVKDLVYKVMRYYPAYRGY